MEKLFGVSYPTVKNRLNRIGAQLPFVEVEPVPDEPPARTSASELLSRLERGEITAREVLLALKPLAQQEANHE